MTSKQLAHKRRASGRKTAKRSKPPVSNKQLAMLAIRQSPDESTFDEIIERIEILALIRKGEESADAGDLIPHEEFKRHVERWLSK